MMEKFRKLAYLLAESFDIWRVVPRFIIISYSYLVWSLYQWYKSIPTYVQIKCDAALFEILLAKGQTMAMVKELACGVIGTTGGPTSEQTAFVTIIIGLSSAIFALYTSTSKKWDSSPHAKKSDNE
jgi:hypothetical protein